MSSDKKPQQPPKEVKGNLSQAPNTIRTGAKPTPATYYLPSQPTRPPKKEK